MMRVKRNSFGTHKVCKVYGLINSIVAGLSTLPGFFIMGGIIDLKHLYILKAAAGL